MVFIQQSGFPQYRPLITSLLVLLLTACALQKIRFWPRSPEMVWFQKEVVDSATTLDLAACRANNVDEKGVSLCMRAKGYLWIPREEAELLRVRTLQEKGLKQPQIASQLQWDRQKVLRYTDESFRLDPINALGRQPVDLLASLGKPAVPLLIDELRRPDSLSRRQAAVALGDIGDARAVEPLIVLLKDPNALIRRHAVKALGKIRDLRALVPLIKVLGNKDEQAHVKTAAAQALGRIGQTGATGPLVLALKDPTWAVRSTAAKALGMIGDPRAVEPLILALGDADPTVRAHVVDALGRIKDPRAIEPLRWSLKDRDSEVRRRAKEALAKLLEISRP